MRADAAAFTPFGVVEIPRLGEATDMHTLFCQWQNVFLFRNFRDLLCELEKVGPEDGACLAVSDLVRSTYDSGLPAAPGRLWHMGRLLEKQINGKQGPLLTNGLANIFPLGSSVK